MVLIMNKRSRIHSSNFRVAVVLSFTSFDSCFVINFCLKINDDREISLYIFYGDY